MPGYPAATPAMPDSGAPSAMAPQKEVWYLGTRIPDPDEPPASLAQTKIPGYHPTHDYNKIIQMKGWYAEGKGNITEMSFVKFVLEEPLLTRDALSDYCVAKRGKDLYDTLQDSSPRMCLTTSHVTTVVRALIRGPLRFDVELLYGALSGVGANEMVLTEIILNRSHEDIALLNKAYTKSHGRELKNHIEAQSDISLSADLKRTLTMALYNQRDRSLTVDHNAVSVDVEALIQGRKGKEDKERSKFIEIFVNRSKPHLAAVITAFGQKSKSLSSVIKGSKYFTADFKGALLFILHGVKPKRDGQGIWRDAKLLEKTMVGLGTKDTALVYRLVRAHWDPTRFGAVKTAYQNHYNKTLEKRVTGETSGNYRETLLALIAHASKAKPT
ncbi:hypothetical protein BKA70DRAFT_1185640 [Coprinopsis sp. MPI-PUGE-AT-0042]|nr:hypothetical protein BKA70DRAFT_1185640 [Coprinopsis sp. MPI-PUGE-AT-0042]